MTFVYAIKVCMKKKTATITRSNNRKKANRKGIERWKKKDDFIAAGVVATGSPVPKFFRPLDEKKKTKIITNSYSIQN